MQHRNLGVSNVHAFTDVYAAAYSYTAADLHAGSYSYACSDIYSVSNVYTGSGRNTGTVAPPTQAAADSHSYINADSDTSDLDADSNCDAFSVVS